MKNSKKIIKAAVLGFVALNLLITSCEKKQSRFIEVSVPVVNAKCIGVTYHKPLEEGCKAEGDDCTRDEPLDESSFLNTQLGTEEAKFKVWVVDLGNGEFDVKKFSDNYTMTKELHDKIILSKSFNVSADDTLNKAPVYNSAFKLINKNMPIIILAKGKYTISFIGTTNRASYQKLTTYKVRKNANGGFSTTIEVLMGDVK